MEHFISYGALFITYIGYVLVFIGGAFLLTGIIGMFRFPDFFTRLHPAGVIDSLGSPLIIFGVMLTGKFDMGSIKTILLIIFLLITTPTACHALAKSALSDGLKPIGKITGRRKK